MPTVPRTAYFLATLLALASCVLVACSSAPIVSRADNAQLAYSYDPPGNRLTLTDAVGDVTLYGYDAANRLTSVSAPGVGATTYAYDTASQLRGRTGQGGLVTDYGYDDAGRIASITHRIGSTPTLSIGYTHNANGNRIQQVIEHAGSAAETTDFEYDAADRLVRSHDGQSDTRWTLDAAGNCTLEEVREGGVLTRRTAYTVDVRDRLRTATPELPTGPPTEYAYDTNGNLLSETTGSAVTTYRWDARDRLIEQTLPGQSAIQNRYDDADRRIARSDGASGSRYRWDGNALLEETNAVGNRLTRYHRGAGLIGASSASESRLYLTDSQNTPLALLRTDGAISGRAQYDIWGKTRSESGETSKLGFTGYQKERGDLYQAVARYYRPGSASFLSIDPWEGDYNNPASLNKYLYGYGNPGIFVDPDGRYAESGHYYTVFLAAKAAGYETNRALKIALYAQLPDEVGSLDAINQQVANVTGSNGLNEYNLKQPISPGQQYIGSAQVETKWVPNELSRDNVQRGIHQLTGGGSVSGTNRSRRALTSAKSDEAAGIAAHGLGDSYSHRRIGNENNLYGTGAGHLMDGTDPDMIVRRPELYGAYVKDLVKALAKRRGVSMSDESAEAFAASMVKMTEEPLNDARSKLDRGTYGTSKPISSDTQGTVMIEAERRLGLAIKKRAQGVITEAESSQGVVLLSPEAAETGVFGGTAGHEQRQLNNFWKESLPEGVQLERSVYAPDAKWETVRKNVVEYMSEIAACDNRGCGK